MNYNQQELLEKHRKHNKEYYLKNKDKKRIYDSKRYKIDPVIYRDRRLKQLYGINTEQYNQMFVDQNGACAICGGNQRRKGWSLCVDHNHITGKIRSLLCFRCNFAIGQFRDDMQLVQKSLNYLKKHND